MQSYDIAYLSSRLSITNKTTHRVAAKTTFVSFPSGFVVVDLVVLLLVTVKDVAVVSIKSNSIFSEALVLGDCIFSLCRAVLTCFYLYHFFIYFLRIVLPSHDWSNRRSPHLIGLSRSIMFQSSSITTKLNRIGKLIKQCLFR